MSLGRFTPHDATPALVAPPCPTCSGPVRETVGMVCQTCGTDYSLPEVGASLDVAELPTLDALVDQLDEARALVAGVADVLPELRHRATSDDVRELLDTLAVHVSSAWASVVLAHNIARPAAPVAPA